MLNITQGININDIDDNISGNLYKLLEVKLLHLAVVLKLNCIVIMN